MARQCPTCGADTSARESRCPVCRRDLAGGPGFRWRLRFARGPGRPFRRLAVAFGKAVSLAGCAAAACGFLVGLIAGSAALLLAAPCLFLYAWAMFAVFSKVTEPS